MHDCARVSDTGQFATTCSVMEVAVWLRAAAALPAPHLVAAHQRLRLALVDGPRHAAAGRQLGRARQVQQRSIQGLRAEEARCSTCRMNN